MPVKTEAGVREYPVTREPLREPTHPGELLEEVLETEQVSVMAAAEALGVSRQTLHRVLAKQMGASPEMAIRLGAFVGNGPGLWLRMQSAYDLWHAEHDASVKRSVVPIAEARKTGVGAKAARAKAAAGVTARRAAKRPKAKARA